MTEELFRTDAYLKQCDASVVAVTERGIVLDRTVFYPEGGGQPGDRGCLRLTTNATVDIIDTIEIRTNSAENTAADQEDMVQAAVTLVLNSPSYAVIY